MIVADVLVVGGGIVGAAIAVQCARRGMRVSLLEGGALASGASSLDLALAAPSLAPPALRPLAEHSVEEYRRLHRFTGGAFFLDQSVPDEHDLRRIDVRAAVLALVEEARAYRAEVRTGCEVKSLLLRGRTVLGAATDLGEARAKTTVVAAGAASWRVCRALGGHVPIRGEPVDLLVTAPAPFSLERPAVVGLAWVAQDQAGRLVAADPAEAARGFPQLEEVPVLERRALAAPVSADGLPLHGPLPGVDGLVLARGHGRYGVACAPGAAGAIAQGVWDPALDPARLLG